MKIVVISDIHGSEFYMKRAEEAFEREKGDYLLILGDELYHGPRNSLPRDYNPKGVVEILNTFKERVLAVRGNCDSEVDQMLLEYPIMADYTVLFLEGVKIFATHGHIYNKEKMPLLSKGDVLIYGHTHVYEAFKNEEGIFILNPGSISLAKNGNENTYGVFENNRFMIKNLDGEIKKEIDLK